MTAATVARVLCARAYGGGYDVPDVQRVLPMLLRAVCVCGVHFGVFCAVWWRAAVTRLGSDTRCKPLQLYLIIFISSPC